MTTRQKPQKQNPRVPQTGSRSQGKAPRPAAARGTLLRSPILHACLLALAVLVAYSNSLTNGFVWDDHQQIAMNPGLQHGARLTTIFSSDMRFAQSRNDSTADVNHEYRPLQMLSYRAIAAVSGFAPLPFHIASLLLAVAGVLAAYALLLLLTQNTTTAFVAALIFAVDPVHTEAVDWLSAASDLGCGFFFLLAFALFLLSRRPPNQQNPRPAWLLPALSLLSFAASLLWKEQAAVFPILIALYLLLLEEKTSHRIRRAFTASAAYWLLLAVWFPIRSAVLHAPALGGRNWGLSPFQSLLSAADLMLSYWLKLAWPFALNAYYVFSPVRSVADLRAVAAIVFLLAALAAIVYFKRRAPLAVFAILWIFITLLPVMDIYALGTNAFAERYLYLPSLGFCLLLTLAAAWLIARLPAASRKPAAVLALAAIVVAFAAATIARNPVWKDDATLFSATLLESPDSAFVRDMVAAEQSDASPGSVDAEQNYQEAILLAQAQTPTDRVDLLAAYLGLASLYADRSDFPNAFRTLAEAKQLAPSNPRLGSLEGLMLAQSGQWAQAEPILEQAYKDQPDNENVLLGLGLSAWQYRHNLGQAQALFSRALAAHTENDAFQATLHNNLGGVFAEGGDFASAIDQFKAAIGISPDNPEYHTNLANAFGAANRYPEARVEAETALRIDPNYAPARGVLEALGSR